MRITKEIKELAKEIHKAEHLFVEKKISKDHKLEEIKDYLDIQIAVFDEIVWIKNFFNLTEGDFYAGVL